MFQVGKQPTRVSGGAGGGEGLTVMHEVALKPWHPLYPFPRGLIIHWFSVQVVYVCSACRMIMYKEEEETGAKKRGPGES